MRAAASSSGDTPSASNSPTRPSSMCARNRPPPELVAGRSRAFASRAARRARRSRPASAPIGRGPMSNRRRSSDRKWRGGSSQPAIPASAAASRAASRCRRWEIHRRAACPSGPGAFPSAESQLSVHADHSRAFVADLTIRSGMANSTAIGAGDDSPLSSVTFRFSPLVPRDARDGRRRAPRPGERARVRRPRLPHPAGERGGRSTRDRPPRT